MKKLLLSAIFFSILFFVSCGDDDNGTEPTYEPILKLVSADTVVTGSTFMGDELVSYAQVENTGNTDIELMAKMEVVELPEGAQIALCLGMCYAATTEDFTIPESYTLAANSLTESHDFSGHYYFNLGAFPVTGTAKIKYTIWVEGHPEDAVSYTCTFTVN